jgi:HAMP domain-containing protein
MLLRESGKVAGQSYDVRAITDDAASSGVPHGDALTAFADVAVQGPLERLAEVRDAVEAEMSREAVVDAAGVIANFQRMVRIADSTGIPLDKPVAIFTVDLREELGLDAFGAAANTPQVGAALRMLGRIAQPLVRPIMSFYAGRRQG